MAVEIRTQAPPPDPAAEAVFGGERMESGDAPDEVEKYAEDQPRDKSGRFAESAADRGAGRMLRTREPDRAAPSPEEEAGTDGKPHLGDCYRQAGNYVASHEGAVLVHGEISPPGWLKGGFRGGHAWAEIRRPGGAELVYDGAQGKFYDKASYYREMAAVPQRTYTADEALVQMLRTRHWGPWH